MATQSRPVKTLTTRGGIRRKSVGIRTIAQSYSCRVIDAACNEFFKERGLPVYGQFGNPLPAKS